MRAESTLIPSVLRGNPYLDPGLRRDDAVETRYVFFVLFVTFVVKKNLADSCIHHYFNQYNTIMMQCLLQNRGEISALLHPEEFQII